MAKKDKNKKKAPETTIEDYYDLKSDEMDELVAALKGEIDESEPVVTMNIAEITGDAEDIAADSKKRRKKSKEFDPYKRDTFSKVPRWLKACFIKFWFFGCVCYFVLMGLPYLIYGSADLSNEQWLDMLVVCGIVTGIVVDCLVNPIFRMMESDKKEYNNYMMFPFPFKQIWTFFTNIIYYTLIMVGVNYAYMLLNVIITGGTDTISVAMEPLLFGVFTLIVDMAFIGIKDLIVFLIKKLINKRRESKANKVSEGENA